MDRIQNFCSDITIDIAFESDANDLIYKTEASRVKKLGIDTKVRKVKQAIKTAKKSMTNHDFKTAKRDLTQVKSDIADIRSTINSIEPSSNESILISKICTGIASAVIVITGAYIGGVVGGIPKTLREREKLIKTTSDREDAAMAKWRSSSIINGPDGHSDWDKAKYEFLAASTAGTSAIFDFPRLYHSKVGAAGGAGISFAPVNALHKFMNTRIERKAQFIKILDLCDASVNELIANCNEAEKTVNQ